MKKWVWTALIFSLLSALGHFYLAKRAYQLKAGQAKASLICDMGKNINCDSALLSPYAELFGVSLSNFGLGSNLSLAGLLIFFLLFGAGVYWKNISFYLAGAIALASIAMSAISLAGRLICPVCWSLYLFSFIVLAGLLFAFREDLKFSLSFAVQSLREKSLYILGACLFLISLFFHVNFINAYDIKSQEEMLSAVFSDWRRESAISLPPDHLLESGAPDSKMLVVEFADFLCPACKKTQPALKSFLANFPEASLRFYAYPLDGACNPAIDFTQSGLSCKLSKALICAEEQGRGWAAHDFFFEKQELFLESRGKKEKVKSLMENLLDQTGMDRQKFKLCENKPSVLEKVRRSALAGERAKIQGTPSFFVNGKKIRQYSPKLLILQKIHRHLEK